jgi:RND family efflux transporter MFP subunit
MQQLRDRLQLSAVIASALFFTGCSGEPAGTPGGGGPPPAKTPEVYFVTPTRDNLLDYEDCTGRTEAFKTVDVRARVTGYLEKWNFSPGKPVKKGDVLFEIDPRSYLAELARAEATVVQAEAHLARLSADYQRAQNLFSSRAMGREDLDKIIGDRAEAVAAVGIAKASRDLAKLNLDYTHVTAALDGIVSRSMVDPGNMVKADETILTTVVTQDPIYAYFDIDERNALRLSRQLAQGEMKYPPVQMGLADEEPRFPHRGTIDFVDNRLDTNTGTWHMRCSFPNPDGFLKPGLFVRIRFLYGELQKVILIPEEAITADQDRKYVYVINDKDQIEHRQVKIGKMRNGLRAVTDGLKGDEHVVVKGVQRVRPGVTVVAKPVEAANTGGPGKPPTAGISGDKGAGQSPAGAGKSGNAMPKGPSGNPGTATPAATGANKAGK